MILPDGGIRVDFVIDLPANKVGEWFVGIMPGAQHDIADEIDDDKHLEVGADDIEDIKRNLVIQFRYYGLSGSRTEVRAYCSQFFHGLLDERLVLVGTRFPESRADIREALGDAATARLLPKTRAQIDVWLENENKDARIAANPLVEVTALLHLKFNVAELRELCDYIGVDDEDFPRKKKDFARELVLYMNRRDRLHELLEIVKKLRPHLEWPKATN